LPGEWGHLTSMKRIAIVGCSGAGKSTFARRLHGFLKVPLIHLDQLFWKEGWVMVDREEFLKSTHEVYQQPEWIIDGNYLSSASERFKHCDTIIHLDYPTHVCLYRTIKRTLSGYGRTRLDMTEGCPERFDWEFFNYVLTYRRKMRPRLMEAIRENKADSCRIVTLQAAVQAEAFLSDVASEQAGAYV